MISSKAKIFGDDGGPSSGRGGGDARVLGPDQGAVLETQDAVADLRGVEGVGHHHKRGRPA